MERLTVAEGIRDIETIFERVANEGITVELERDNRVIVRITPSNTAPRIEGGPMASDLNELFASLPSLGDDAESFADDVEQGRRSFKPEVDPWR